MNHSGERSLLRYKTFLIATRTELRGENWGELKMYRILDLFAWKLSIYPFPRSWSVVARLVSDSILMLLRGGGGGGRSPDRTASARGRWAGSCRTVPPRPPDRVGSAEGRWLGGGGSVFTLLKRLRRGLSLLRLRRRRFLGDDFKMSHNCGKTIVRKQIY